MAQIASNDNISVVQVKVAVEFGKILKVVVFVVVIFADASVDYLKLAR